MCPEEKDHLVLGRLAKNREYSSKLLNDDRRKSHDRRRLQDPYYFQTGGIERRSGRERKYFWYMTF